MVEGGPAVNGWIYFLGERAGQDIKVGASTGKTVAARVKQVNAEQTADASYVLLAAVRGDRKEETAVKRSFEPWRRSDKGKRTEYFIPSDELAEYVNWLRQWWWVDVSGEEELQDLEAVSSELWLPADDRRLPRPESDPELLVQPFQALEGPLAGTAWDWMVSPKVSIQDYFTPPEIIEAARAAMGGIDLDAASHPIANRALRIPDYFHINRNAFDNDWYGRVWLNPPYGNNAPWFERIQYYIGRGEVEQLCMLSPLWAFTAEQARPAMRMSSATVLLSPTPTFWGNSQNKTGTNHPHAIVYWGARPDHFVAALEPFGIPLKMAWDRIGEFVPEAA